MLKTIDQFLLDSEFLNLKSAIVENPEFPWYYTKVLDENSQVDQVYNYQFAHILYQNRAENSCYSHLLNPLYDVLKIDCLVKAKINFNPRTETIIEHGMHCDYPFECLTAVYYLNTNNGYTRFESGERVESLENRIVIFDSQTRHTGTTCTNAQGRYVLNLNFYSL